MNRLRATVVSWICGCVVNTAIDLNGQSPIQTYMRVTEGLVITIGSIDLGTRITITDQI
jgi:hypothetical protein